MVCRALVDMATRRRARGKGTKRVRGGGGCTSKDAIKGKCVEPSAAASAAAAKPGHVKLNETTTAANLARHTRDIDAKNRQITELEASILAKDAEIRATPKADRAKSIRILKSKHIDQEKLALYKTHLKALEAMKKKYEETIAARQKYDVAIGLGLMNNARRARNTLKRLHMNMERRTGPALQKFKSISRKHGLSTPKRSASRVATAAAAAGVGIRAVNNNSSGSNASSENNLNSNSGNNATIKEAKEYLRQERAKSVVEKKKLKVALGEAMHKSAALENALDSIGKTLEKSMGIPSNAEIAAQLAALNNDD